MIWVHCFGKAFNYPEVELYGVCNEYVKVLSKIIFYPLQDGCKPAVQVYKRHGQNHVQESATGRVGSPFTATQNLN